MTSTVINSNHLATLIKEKFPKILIVVGGPHITALPSISLKEFPCFDIAVIGEGEETMLEICQHRKNNIKFKGIKGIAHRRKNKIIIEKTRPLISNLDILPFPARQLVDMKLYKGFTIMTTRGCPYNCIFCAGHLNYHNRIRFRSSQNVIKEIKECIKKYNAKHFMIMDDTFTLNKKLVYEICDGLKRLNVSWFCNTRVNTINKELLNKIAESGCTRISFGVESGSSRILKLIKKGITVEQVKEAFRLAHKSRIKFVDATYIVGSHPTETMEDIKMTINLINETKPDRISVSIIVPFPGTELYEIMRKEGYLRSRNWNSFVIFGKTPTWRTKNFSSNGLVKIQKMILRRFYLNPHFIYIHIKNIRNFKQFLASVIFSKKIIK